MCHTDKIYISNIILGCQKSANAIVDFISKIGGNLRSVCFYHVGMRPSNHIISHANLILNPKPIKLNEKLIKLKYVAPKIKQRHTRFRG